MFKYAKTFVLTKRSVCCFIHLNKISILDHMLQSVVFKLYNVVDINTCGIDIICGNNYVIIIRYW